MWLLVAVLAVGYWIAVVRVGPRYAVPGQPVVTRLQITCWSLGVFAIWLSSDWPIHDFAEESMYSVHMVQHLLVTLIAVPLLLLGTPAWLARYLLDPGSTRFRIVRFWSRFIPAVIVFNVMLVLTHVPAIVNASLHSGLLHFSIHAALFVTSVIVWMPVMSPLPEIPRLTWLSRMIYLFLQSIVPTIPASFMTLGDKPLYKFYIGHPASLGREHPRRPTDRGPHHEDRRGHVHLGADRGDLLPVGRRRGTPSTSAGAARPRPRALADGSMTWPDSRQEPRAT